MTCLVLSILVVSRVEAQSGQWMLASTADREMTFIDSAGISIERGGLVETWIKRDLVYPGELSNGTPYDVVLLRWSIDCPRGTVKSTLGRYYRGDALVRTEMGRAGRRLYRKPRSSDDQATIRMICRLAAEKREPPTP